MDTIEHNPEAVDDVAAPARRRKRLIWAAVVVSVLLLLLLTPPLLNVNRLRLRIAGGMSATLGRPVHLDKVSVHLLPVPGFTLQNLVVSEDPAFGDEPVIRAMKVELTLRPSSLWRRHVEISSIRFEVDDGGSAPSLNLVRNARGEWNVQSLLMHAAQVDTEPTAQTTPGPAPRFPYIEATGGRVNLKLGIEKQPFSLTDADFALWLPTPENWHVRLEGKPARTDTNASNTGTVSLEGQLQRAARMADVPVDLRVSWHDAPLGQASKLIAGEDAGWRGTLMVDATLVGPLRSAKWSTQLHLKDLRRADFVPVKLLDVDLECDGDVDITSAVLTDPSCTMATPVPEGRKDAGQVVAIADKVDIQRVRTPGFGATGLRVGMTNVADSWLLDWARLFSQRVPVNESPQGQLAGSVVLAPATEGREPNWQGEFHGEIVGNLPWDTQQDSSALHPVAIAVDGTDITLAPISLSAPGKAPLTVSAEATPQQYALHLAGEATPEKLNALRGMLPVLGDGLESAVPELNAATPAKPAAEAKPEAEKQLKLNVTCTRAWPAAQTCVNAPPEQLPKAARRSR
jgi:AsmA protein